MILAMKMFLVCVFFSEQHGLWPLKRHFHPQYNAEVMALGDSKGMANMLVVSILCQTHWRLVKHTPSNLSPIEESLKYI